MRCRAWETKHKNGRTYLHVVDESLEVEVVKDIAERVANSPIADISKFPIHRDVVGSYLLTDKGHESMGFYQFVPFDSHVLDDYKDIKDAVQCLVRSFLFNLRCDRITIRCAGVKYSISGQQLASYPLLGGGWV